MINIKELFNNYELEFKHHTDHIMLNLLKATKNVRDTEEMDLKKVGDEMTEAEQCLKQMELEASSLPPQYKRDLMESIRTYKNELKQIEKDLKKIEQDREEAQYETDLFGDRPTKNQINQALLNQEDRLVEQNFKLLGAKQAAYETEETAIQIQKALQQQTSTLEHSIVSTQSIRDDLGESNALVNRMKHRIQQRRLMVYGVLTMQTNKRNRFSLKSRAGKNTSIGWILNLLDTFQKQDLSETNLLPIPESALIKLHETEPLLDEVIYAFDQAKSQFVRNRFKFYPNMLVKLCEDIEDKLTYLTTHSEYLVLSSCQLHRKVIHYKDFVAFGIILVSIVGQSFLFFDSQMQCMDWFQQFKKYCKLTNFLAKFQVKDKSTIPNIFSCIKQKNNKLYTVQIFKQSDLLKNKSLSDTIMNEIGILMSLKHPSLLNFLKQYEDSNHLYVVFDYWQGDSLHKWVMNGIVFSQVEIANLMNQIIKVVKLLHINHLYHGVITPQNIIVLRNNAIQDTSLRVVLMNFAYREKIQNWNWLKKRIPIKWIPPELALNDPAVEINPQKIDSYLIGCTLFYLCLYRPFLGQMNKEIPFERSIENFQIDIQRIQQCRSDLVNNVNGHEFMSLSLVDLLLGLLDPDPQLRLSVSQVAKHQWFVNQKNKMIKIKKGVIFPTLKTIIELREQSSYYDIATQRKNKEMDDSILISQESDKNFQDDDYDNVHRISSEDNFIYAYMRHLNGYSGINHPRKKFIGINLK